MKTELMINIPTDNLWVAISQTFNVVSLEAVTSRRESGEKAHWYTGATWPLKVLMNLPSLESQSLV